MPGIHTSGGRSFTRARVPKLVLSGDEVPPPPPPFEVATRPWFGSSAPEGLTGFNRLQTNIVKRSLELRRVFSPDFEVDPTDLLMPDILAGRVPVYSNKPPADPDDWYDFFANIAALPGFVIFSVNHEPENDGWAPADFAAVHTAMMSRSGAATNCWKGIIFMAVTFYSAARVEWLALADTLPMDVLMVDGYNGLNRRSFAQIFDRVRAKAASRTDLVPVTGIPWGVTEFSTHGTDVQRSNWVKGAQSYWEKPENESLKFVIWYDSDLGDNAAVVGWRLERALPDGWYAQEMPGKPAGKLYARAAPPHDPEWVEDLLTPATVNSVMNTRRRALGPVIPPPEPPPEPPDYGALAAGQTNYPIPDGEPPAVVFCAPNGVDNGAGTEGNPYRTLGRCLEVVTTGGTVVMRGGEYPEQDLDGHWDRTSITVQAYPGEAPVLTGSDVVTGWLQDDTGPGGTPRWRRNNWNHVFDETPAVPQVVDPAHPEAPKPYQVWIDDVALEQVSTLADVDNTAPNEAGAPGTFWYDTAAKVLWIGSTPFNKTVRVSTRQVCFTGAANPAGERRVDFKGITVRDYATSNSSFAAMRLDAADTVLEHCHFLNNAAAGVFLNRTVGARVAHCTFERNGQMGLRGYHAEYTEVTRCRVYRNNRKMFATGQAAGGMKIDTESFGLDIHENWFQSNVGYGMWVDIADSLSLVYRNEFRDHVDGAAGCMFELTSNGAVFGNYFKGNVTGLKVAEAGSVDIYNNTFHNNTTHWTTIHGDRPEEPGQPWTFDQVRFTARNNVYMQEIADNNVTMMHQDDLHGDEKDYIAVEWTADYDAFWWKNNQGTAKVARILLPTDVHTSYADVSDLPGTLEDNAIYDDTSTTNPFYDSNGDPTAAITGNGTAVPAIVASRLGWSPETTATPNRGWK